MKNPSRKTLSSYTFSLSSCRLDVVRCAGTCLRMRSLRQMHFIFPPAEPMVSARLHFSAVQKYFLQRLFSCPWVQLGRCTSPMHMHSHRHRSFTKLWIDGPFGFVYFRRSCHSVRRFESNLFSAVLASFAADVRIRSVWQTLNLKFKEGEAVEFLSVSSD
jgi:hypothetical protein